MKPLPPPDGHTAEGTAKGLEAQRPQEAEPTWLWRGTHGSADRGIISLLALLETLVATAVAAGIALRYGTQYLVVSACIAPLLLLRTPASQELGLRWGLRASDWVVERLGILLDILPIPTSERAPRAILVPLYLLYLLLGLVFGFIIWTLALAAIALLTLGVRFLATVVAFCRTPFQCLEAIPGNWWRNIACIDMTHMPEPLPGIDRAIDAPEFSAFANAQYLHPGRAFKEILEEEPDMRWFWVVQWLFAALFFLLVALPAWLYRWTLKGTFLLYSPLVWVVRRSFADNPWDRLRDIRELAFHRVIRGYSRLVLALLVAKVALDLLLPTWPSLWAGLPSAALLDAVLAPQSLPLWQIALGTNALMAWVLYFYADRTLVRHERGRPPEAHRVDGTLRALWLVRTSLSVYVIGNGIHAAAVLAGVLPM